MSGLHNVNCIHLQDAGQKKFGVTQCPVCGMVYCHADQVDEAAHAKFHRQHQEALKFTVSKSKITIMHIDVYTLQLHWHI